MTLYKCAVCSIRFDKKSKASVFVNRNKIRISSPWLVHLMQKRSIDHTTYKWVCGECHRNLSKTCNDKQKNELFYELANQNITEDIEIVPSNYNQENQTQEPRTSTELLSLDFAAISDERCKILTGVSKENFLDIYYLISKTQFPGKVSLINAL